MAFTLSIESNTGRRRPDLRLIAMAGLIATLIGRLKSSGPDPTPASTPTPIGEPCPGRTLTLSFSGSK